MAVYVLVAAAAAAAAYAIAASRASKASLSNQAPSFQALRIQTSTNGMAIPVVFGTNRITGNLMWVDEWWYTTTQNQQGGKGGGGGGGSYTTIDYKLSFIMALCEGQIAGIGQCWADKSIYTSPAAMGLTEYDGADAQSAWPYPPLAFPGSPYLALNYPGIAYVCVMLYDLGSSGVLPNLTFEVKGLNIVAGLQDANPADIITQMITNTKFGLVPGFPLDTTDYTLYCLANNFLLSPAFVDQQPLAQHVKDILDQSFSTCVWHDASILKIVPYGDTSATGNGVTWNPNVTPLYDLTDDDFLGDNSADPIKVTRKSPAQAENDVKIEFSDRTNNYNPSVAEAMDQGSIDLYMKRPSSTIKMHAICQASIASHIAQLTQQQQLYIRNQFEFQLSGLAYGHLEPMDIVTLTDSGLGLNKYPVRIIQIDENESWDLDITAEDFPEGVGHAALYSRQVGSGYAVNYNLAPGNVNTPVVFNAPGILTASGFEIWCALSGGANWGGCDVYASTDGTTYKFVQRVYGPSRYGILSASLAAGADPDIVHTCAVDLTTSLGALLSGTQADADNKVTLCLVDNELISYETATLTATYKYNLTYLRRGCYGSAIVAHNINAEFVRLDAQIAKIPFDPSLSKNNLIDSWIKDPYHPYDTFTSAGPNITSAIYSSSGQLSCNSSFFSVTVGQPYEVAVILTLNSGQAPFLCYGLNAAHNAWLNSSQLIAGVNTFTWNSASTWSGEYISFYNNAASNWSATVAVYQANGTGQTIYLKFCSFNKFLLAIQGLADVSPYTFVIGPGLSFPSNVANFTATLQETGQVAFSWTPVADSNLLGYEIRYGPQGSATWSTATPICKETATTHFISATVPAGIWEFFVCAVDVSGNYSPTPSTASLTVTLGLASFSGSSSFNQSNVLSVASMYQYVVIGAAYLHNWIVDNQSYYLGDIATWPTGTIYNAYIAKQLYVVTPSWAKNRRFKVAVNVNVQNTGNQYTLFIGDGLISNDPNWNKPPHYGFHIANGAFYGSVGNGSAETTVNLNTTCVNSQTYSLEADYFAGVGVNFYINGTLLGSITTGLPTGASDANVIFHIALAPGNNGSPNVGQVQFYDYIMVQDS